MGKKCLKRLDRDEWFARTLEHIAREGNVRIRIYQLAKSLGVTEGSFYWHFKNRSDFLTGLVDYWGRMYTEVVIKAIRDVQGDAESRLRRVVDMVINEDLAGYDFAMQALAIKEPTVARAIRKVYRLRFEYIGSLFAEMGFHGQDMEMRTEAFVTYVSLQRGLYRRKSKKERWQLLRKAVDLFTDKR